MLKATNYFEKEKLVNYLQIMASNLLVILVEISKYLSPENTKVDCKSSTTYFFILNI